MTLLTSLKLRRRRRQSSKRAYQNCISFDLYFVSRNLISSLTIHNIFFDFKRSASRGGWRRGKDGEQWRRAESHGASKLAMPLLFFNISTSIRLLMVWFLFSCVIFAQRITSGWLFSSFFPASRCSFHLIGRLPSFIFCYDSVHSSSSQRYFYCNFLDFFHHRSIKNRNDRRSSDESNLIPVPTHNFSSRIARDKNCFSISTVNWRRRRFLHSTFNVNVNQFKYSKKHRRARWRWRKRRKSAVSETSMGY